MRYNRGDAHNLPEHDLVYLARLYQRKWLLVRLPLIVCAIATIAWLWLVVYPMPPDRLSIGTAGKDGAYYRIGSAYAEFFASHGVQLDVLNTDGSQENLERLGSSYKPVDLALMQGGFGFLGEPTARRGRSGIETLANVNTEVVWIFSRERQITSLGQLQGLRVSVGAERSGSSKIALKLFDQAKLDLKGVNLQSFVGLGAVQALRDGATDVVFMVTAPDSKQLQSMLRVPGIQLANLQKSAAIVERNPYLEIGLLPQGALESRVPTRDTTMLTLSTSLVARESLHPALKRLAISAALEVNSKGGLFHRAGDFPSLRRIDFPTSQLARTALTHGLPFHARILPFWWAEFAERLLLLVLPVVLLTFWLMVRIPDYLHWALQSRVNRWYGELKFIENDLSQQLISGLDLTRFLSRLNGIDSAVLAFACPKELVARCYTLHQHIEFVRQRLYRMRGR